MSRQPEALSWAATVLALSIAGLAYLYTTRRDAKERKVQREGLLAQHMNSAAQRGHSHGKMLIGWRDDADKIGFFLVEHFFEIGIVGADAVLSGCLFRAFGASTRHRHDLCSWMRLKDRNLNVAAERGSGNCDS